jgi:DNA-3-methyladenine glycosylase II
MLWGMTEHHTLLPASAPFDFSCSLRALAGFSPCSGDQRVAEGRVRKALPHPVDPRQAVVVEVGPPPDGFTGVALTVFAETALSASEAAQVELAVDRWLGLSEDRTAFLAAADADPAMRRVLAVARGLHQVRFSSLAEGTVYFTLTQRSTQWFAAARKRRVADEQGPRLVVDGVEYVAFPAMSTVLGLDLADLTRYAGSRSRAERLREVLDGVAALDEQWLRTADYELARSALLAIKGVGTFTAHAILLRVLGRPDDTPLEMAQFTRVASMLYGEPTPLPAEIRERYGPWVGWWAYTSRTALAWTDSDSASGERRKRPGRQRTKAVDGEPDPEPAAESARPAAQSGARPAAQSGARPAAQSGARPAAQPVAQPAADSSQRSSVRTPHPVAPLTVSPSLLSDQAGDDMSICAQLSRMEPVNSRR